MLAPLILDWGKGILSVVIVYWITIITWWKWELTNIF